MKSHLSLRYWLLVLFALLSSTMVAQQSREQLASYYFSHGEYAQAAEIYESLYDKSDNKFYYQMLLNSYLEMQQYRDAERLVEKRLKKHERDVYLFVDLGRVYHQRGDIKKAEKEYDNAIAKLRADHQCVEQTVRAFEYIGRQDLMIETYLMARRVMRSEAVYVMELAALYGSLGRYDEMTKEYLDLLDAQPSGIGSIQLSLQRTLQQSSDPAMSDGLRKALIERLREQPDNKSYIDMMIWYALQVKDFEFAMIQAVAVDARYPEVGREQIYRVANISMTNEEYDVARQCFQMLIDKGDTHPYYFKSREGLLKSQFQKLNRNFPMPTDELKALRDEYAETIQLMGKNANTVPMMRDYAKLLAYYDNDVQAGADVLYDILEMPRLNSHIHNEVKLELGDLLLFAGERWEASLLYMQVEKAFKDDALGAQAKLSNAKLSYYIGEFEWAKSQLDVLRASTSKLVANDAMELSLLISDNMEDDSTYGLLQLYANADLFLYRNMLDSALLQLEKIQQSTLSHPLLDEVMMQEAKIYMRRQDYNVADSLLKKVVDFYPEDILADDALMLRAELNEQRLNNADAARECYEKLLLDYSSSLYVEKARKRYNQLRNKK